ncbi:hypothetical protein [Streptomyces sp. NPDC090057]
MPIFPWLRYGSGYTDAWPKAEEKKPKKKRTAKKKTQKKGK